MPTDASGVTAVRTDVAWGDASNADGSQVGARSADVSDAAAWSADRSDADRSDADRSESGVSDPFEFSSEPCLTLTSPTDVLAAVPYLVGFHPTASLVVVGLAEGRAKMVARWGLPFPPGTLDAMTPLIDREGITDVVIVGYGPGDLVTPAVDEARTLALTTGIQVGEALRAHEGRYWSYICNVATCCPAEGTPYDLSTSPIAAEATVHGLVALPNREALERTVAPVTGPVRMAMRRATSEAIAAFRADLMAAPRPRHLRPALRRRRPGQSPIGAGDPHRRRPPRRRGGGETRHGTDGHESPRRGVDPHARIPRGALEGPDPPPGVALRAPPVASLLAMAAWRSGDSVQATVALERALTTDPGYSMANLLMHALQNLLSPSILRGRLPTPEELDATMGRANPAWLLPLINLLDEEDLHPTLE
ncbi:DUF4192 domain-containing protein [Nonomuraea salmonea]